MVRLSFIQACQIKNVYNNWSKKGLIGSKVMSHVTTTILIVAKISIKWASSENLCEVLKNQKLVLTYQIIYQSRTCQGHTSLNDQFIIYSWDENLFELVMMDEYSIESIL